MPTPSLEQRAVNTIRTLSMDAVQAANSGHPGMPMGMADVAFVLWTEFLRHDPKSPKWIDRDRFILSAGHGSMLLYSLLHLCGYDLPLEELKNFRQWESKTPGHPEFGHTVGVETTTGPLGQGFVNGVGMAMTEAHLAAKFNKPDAPIIDHHIYAIVSDGDLMEGISHEAASLAGHLRLGKLIYLYDDNKISIDGSTDLAFTEDVGKRFEAYGWHVQHVDGHNREAIRQSIEMAKKEERPSLIACRTKIGFGSPSKEGSEASHGAPLGVEEVAATKKVLGADPEKQFHIEADVKTLFEKKAKKRSESKVRWDKVLDNYNSKFSKELKQLQQHLEGRLPQNLDELIPHFESDPKGLASRKASGNTINALAKGIDNFFGGSADLAGSNNTKIEGKGAFQAGSYQELNIHYGVREHAMVSIMNGMALHGGVIPFGGTFLVFADYCKPAIRLAALMKQRIILVFTHDSIGLGEDGPTHQPIDQLAMLRAIPNSMVIRPADANETAQAWKIALKHKTGPVSLILTRQNLPTFARNSENDASNLSKGAYILKKETGTRLERILLATGSEVAIALETATLLEESGLSTRVVSIPSWELFENESADYKEYVLPSSVKKRVSIEAASPFGWERYVGSEGLIIGIDGFGASAPFEKLYEAYGFTADQIAEKAKTL